MCIKFILIYLDNLKNNVFYILFFKNENELIMLLLKVVYFKLWISDCYGYF